MSLSFSELGLSQPIVCAVTAAGYSIPTPIQARAIPVVIAGRDLLGVAQTGTGKTAAFALPVLQRLLASRPESAEPTTTMARPPRERSAKPGRSGRPDRRADVDRPSDKARKIRVLVLAPTRELAGQIAESIATYSAGTPLRHTVVFGGVNQYHQVKALRHGVDLLVATPGRLLDLREQGFIDLSYLQMLVLDEADRMLDMGFLPTVRRIVEMLPSERQTLFFSATMPPEIRDLADSILTEPVRIEIAPVATTAENIAQSVYHVEKGDKLRLLRHLLRKPEVIRTLVFTRTKHGADKLARNLEDGGFRVEAIHGNRSQAQRQRALDSFKHGRVSVLIATDLAARGIDVDGITHVINYDLPLEIDNYVHRIGRTARAGAAGSAISFCSGEERGRLKAIEHLIRQRIDVCRDLPTFAVEVKPPRDSRTDAPRHHKERSARAAQPVAANLLIELEAEPFGCMEDDVVIAQREFVANPPQEQQRPRRPFPSSGANGGFAQRGVTPPQSAGTPRRPRRRRRFHKANGASSMGLRR
jgi:ATP-dependent RNA helicase RhlE